MPIWIASMCLQTYICDQLWQSAFVSNHREKMIEVLEAREINDSAHQFLEKRINS